MNHIHGRGLKQLEAKAIHEAIKNPTKPLEWTAKDMSDEELIKAILSNRTHRNNKELVRRYKDLLAKYEDLKKVYKESMDSIYSEI